MPSPNELNPRNILETAGGAAGLLIIAYTLLVFVFCL